FFFDRFQFNAPGHDVDTFGFFYDLVAVRIGFVVNFTDDLFDQIFHRYQSGDTAVFIDNDYEMVAIVLHFLQKIIDGLGFGNKIHRLDQRTKIVELLALLPDAQQIALVNNTFNIIEIVAEDWNPRMTFVQYQLKQGVYRRLDVDCNDLRARSHEFPRDFVAEMNDGL